MIQEILLLAIVVAIIAGIVYMYQSQSQCPCMGRGCRRCRRCPCGGQGRCPMCQSNMNEAQGVSKKTDDSAGVGCACK